MLYDCLSPNIIGIGSKIHDWLLTLKVIRSAHALMADARLRGELEVDVLASLPGECLSLLIIDRLIPEQELANRSIPELVQYRNENESQLSIFREKLAELSFEIDTNVSGSEYYRKIKKIVDFKIAPEINELRAELMSSYDEAFGKIAIHSTSAIGSSLSATIFAGLDTWEILGACTLTAPRVKRIGCNDVVTLWRRQKTSKSAGFAFLTNLTR